MLIVYSFDGGCLFTSSLPHLASDGLDLTLVDSLQRVIMVCSLLQELFIFSCVPSGTGFLRTSPACTSSIHFLVEGEPAVIQDQCWFHFLIGNELHN